MIVIDNVESENKNDKKAVLTLFADTKTEVPATGALTAAEIPGYKGTILPTSVIWTGDFKVAVLGTDDNWDWKE